MAPLAVGSERTEVCTSLDAPFNVVVISPNALLRQEIKEKLAPEHWRVLLAGNGAEGLRLLREQDINHCVLLLDPMLFDLEFDGFRALIAERFPDVHVLMLNPQTGQLLVGTEPTAVSSRLAHSLNSRGVTLRTSDVLAGSGIRHSPRAPYSIKLRGMIGNAESMQRIWGATRMVAGHNTTVLITGESGTGKDLLAQEIHLISDRRNKPFVVVNCSTIPESLLEAELFGYTKKALTGAMQSRIGRIHAAHGGTLFLDEVGDMPLSLQSKVLRFLEQGKIQWLGGNDDLAMDVRLIAATTVDLTKQIANQQFRKALCHRLAVFPLHLPPLRERMEDLEGLALSFAAKFLPGVVLSRRALQILAQHRWPGNIRELRNVIERATILVGAERRIKPEHILL